MKRICVIGLNYFPEESSTGLYTTEMCEYLSREFEVEVVTGYPYYPEWKIAEEYKNKRGVITEEIKGVKLNRVKQYVPLKVNFLKRIFHYWDFYRKALNVCKNKKIDVVMVILPNIFLLDLGAKLKKKYPHIKIWAHVQDFEIDAGLETLKGIRKIPLLAKSLYTIEKKMFSKFDMVSTISDGMTDKLQKKGVSKEKIYFLPNWVDITSLYPLKESVYRKELGVENKFIVMYSGNIGGKQDWDTVIAGIEKLEEKKDIYFVIAGDGNKGTKIKERLKKFTNVTTLPLQPKERLNEFLNLGDLHIIPQKISAQDSFMPSKLLGIEAVGKPVLCLANQNSTVYKVVERNDTGYVVNEDSYSDFSEKIIMIKHDSKRFSKGLKAREYVVSNYEYNAVLNKLIAKISII